MAVGSKIKHSRAVIVPADENSGGGNTSSAFGENANAVAVGSADTLIASATVTVAAGQVVVAYGTGTFHNTSEGGATPAELGLFIDDDASGSSQEQLDEFQAGALFRNIAVVWRRAGLSAGSHTFHLKANSSSDTPNTEIPAQLGPLVLVVVEG